MTERDNLHVDDWGQTKTQISEVYASTLICRRMVLHFSMFEIKNYIAPFMSIYFKMILDENWLEQI